MYCEYLKSLNAAAAAAAAAAVSTTFNDADNKILLDCLNWRFATLLLLTSGLK